VKRGEVWTVSGGADYAGKPRPVVIVQDDSFGETKSITVCPFTSGDAEASIFRTPVEPTARNGLRAASRFMADKITSIPRSKLGSRMGRLDDDDVVRLDRAMLVFLGLAVTPRIRTEV
jgi:mRNA interferase MazF